MPYPTPTIYDVVCPVTIGTYYTDEVTATKLQINSGDPDLYATMLRKVVPVDPGDYLKVHAFGRWTNDVGLVTGIGWHLWIYNVDSGEGLTPAVWRLISPLNGENILPNGSMHHMPGQTFCMYRIPDDWPLGDRAVVVFRASAHRTTGLTPVQYITVDKQYGALQIERIREGAPPPIAA